MKNKPLLDLHFKMLEDGKMPMSELPFVIADAFGDGVQFASIMGHSDNSKEFWGSMNDDYRYTPLRQNLLLLYAAYKGEL